MAGPYSLSGTGTQTLSAGVTALSIAATPSSLSSQGRAIPANLFDVGLLRPGSPDGFAPAVPIDAASMWMPLPVGCDRLGYALLFGSSIVVTELFGASPAPGPIAVTYGLPDFLSTLSAETIGVELQSSGVTQTASGGWFGANIAVLVPLRINEAYTSAFAWWRNGGTLGGHVDIGVYDHAFARLGHTGSIAQVGISAVQSTAFVVALTPGKYYIAFSCDLGTATFEYLTSLSTRFKQIGCRKQDTAFPLPNPFVPVSYVNVQVPVFGLSATFAP